LGFPDTTQDAYVFAEKTRENCPAIVVALRELGFSLTDGQAAELERGKDFIQLKNGPFDLDIIFAPDGIERFSDAWRDECKLKDFPFATLTTSSRAKLPPIGKKTVNPCHGSGPSASIGCDGETIKQPGNPYGIPWPSLAPR
jgi:hypothetical protein